MKKPSGCAVIADLPDISPQAGLQKPSWGYFVNFLGYQKKHCKESFRDCSLVELKKKNIY